MNEHRYSVNIRWSDDDALWIATSPELDEVMTHGKDYVEAAAMITEAIQLHVESLKAHNQPLPKHLSYPRDEKTKKVTLGEEFAYRVFWSDVDKVFCAECLELPSVIAHGKTQEEAFCQVRIAVSAALEWMRENGEIVPKPLKA